MDTDSFYGQRPSKYSDRKEGNTSKDAEPQNADDIRAHNAKSDE